MTHWVTLSDLPRDDQEQVVTGLLADWCEQSGDPRPLGLALAGGDVLGGRERRACRRPCATGSPPPHAPHPARPVPLNQTGPSEERRSSPFRGGCGRERRRPTW